VETSVSNVTGEFRSRIATYALDSPDSIRSLDQTLTPVPEVTILQSSPTPRTRVVPTQQKNVDQSEEEEEEEEEEQEQEEFPRQRTTYKRPLTTIVTTSQINEIMGREKRRRSDEVETQRGSRSVQTSLREHFLRKADGKERAGRRSDNVALGLLSPEQVTNLFSSVGTGEDEEQDVEEDIDGEGEEEVDEIPEEDSVMEEDENLEDPELEDGEEEVEIEDLTMDDIQDDIPPPKLRIHTDPQNPRKSEPSLFKSRQKNFVHNLTTTTPLTLSTIRTLHQSHQLPHHSSSVHGTISSKKYIVPAEKAEERLSLTVSKEDFARMRIVGQFNLGFIIAVREWSSEGDGRDVEDVFIIDQHASDEKYNFERLQAETVMQVQTLARYHHPPQGNVTDK
jgi:DNA mismatch repair ATPase MutL